MDYYPFNQPVNYLLRNHFSQNRKLHIGSRLLYKQTNRARSKTEEPELILLKSENQAELNYLGSSQTSFAFHALIYCLMRYQLP